MKTFIVTTQSATNPMLLHSTMAEEFRTTDLNKARAIFGEEVAELSKTYTRQGDLSYTPTDYEQSHAVFCHITSPVIDEDGAVVDVEIIEESDYFYEK